MRVMDRAELILDIFSTRARTHEAKLQVELAQLEYMLPRLTRMWTHLSRIRGGIGLRGPGETQLETDRRMIRQKIQHLKRSWRTSHSHRETAPLRAARPMLTTRAGGLHQRRQVEHAARAHRRARHLRRGPALRHARHADPRGRAGRGCAGPGHRHRRLHPQAAAPSGRELPGHARRSARRRRAAARGRRQRIPTGRSRCTWCDRVLAELGPRRNVADARSSTRSMRCPIRPRSPPGSASSIPSPWWPR